MQSQAQQQKSQVTDEWLTEPVGESAPECPDGHGEMWHANDENVGGTPGTDTFLVTYECPECGHREQQYDH